MWSCPSSMRAMLPGKVGLVRISQHGYDEGYDSCIAAAVEFVASAKLMQGRQSSSFAGWVAIMVNTQ